MFTHLGIFKSTVHSWIKVHMVVINCCCSVAKSCLTLCNLLDCSMPGFPVLHHLPELVQTHVHWVGDAIQGSCPPFMPFSSCLLSFPVSGSFPMSQLFGSIRWPKYWSISTFSISPSKEYLGLISFRIDLFDLLAVQGTPRVFSNTTVQKHQFFSTQPSFMVQLWHMYVTTGKTISLTIGTMSAK